MIPDATLCHVCPGRARLRIDAMRGDETWFRSVEQALSRHFGEVVARSSTGSIVLRDARISPEYVHSVAANQALFRLDETEPQRRRTPSFAMGTTTVYTSLGVMLVLLAMMQAYRGRLLAPTATLLWYAVEALHWSQGRE